MHWMLKDEMSPKTYKPLPFGENASEDLLSIKSTDEDWHEDRRSKIPTPSRAPFTQKFEDYRRHHFDMTMPPQLQDSKSANQKDMDNPIQQEEAKVSLPPIDVSPGANLTMEGKRQVLLAFALCRIAHFTDRRIKAQAAGNILRARTAPSRHRKAGMTANDHTMHQNRWADYKSSDSTFSKVPKHVPQGFKKPSLTSEGKRQVCLISSSMKFQIRLTLVIGSGCWR